MGKLCGKLLKTRNESSKAIAIIRKREQWLIKTRASVVVMTI